MKSKSLRITEPHIPKEKNLGYAKQKNLLILTNMVNSLDEHVNSLDKKIGDLEDRTDTLAVHMVNVEDRLDKVEGRLSNVETIVEKTYKLLDTHVKTQIRFDHELAAARNVVDGHEKRLVILETKG